MRLALRIHSRFRLEVSTVFRGKSDKNLIKRIVDNISPGENDNFLEIGPGDGSLTRQIYPHVNEMAVVEIDPLLIKKLQIAKTLKEKHKVIKCV